MKTRWIAMLTAAAVFSTAALADSPAAPDTANTLTITVILQKDQPFTPTEKATLQETIQAALSGSPETASKTGDSGIQLKWIQESPLDPETRKEIWKSIEIQREIRDDMVERLALSRAVLERKIETDPLVIHLKQIIRRLEVRYHDLAKIFKGNLIEWHKVEAVEAQLLTARIELARQIRALRQSPEGRFIDELERQIFHRTIHISEMEMRLRELSSPARPADQPDPPPAPQPQNDLQPNQKLAKS
jgi:hypothetical protein